MKWAAVVVVCSLGCIGLAQALELAVERGRKAHLVASSAWCWDQNAQYRAKLPQWER